MNAPLVVVRRRSGAERVPLPAETRDALARIADELRHLPRECIGDRAELLFWLSRMARRIEAEGDRTVVVSGDALDRRKSAISGKSYTAISVLRGEAGADRVVLSIRDRAEAVFCTPAKPSTMSPKPRTITSRKGRAVRVEARRAPVAQLDLPLGRPDAVKIFKEHAE